MIKKTITFPDLEGNDVTRDFYFNVRIDEAIEAELNQGITSKFQKLTETEDGAKAYWLLKDLILMAYGVRDEDGITFHKSEEISRKFSQTAAFSKLLVEFVEDAKAGAEFFNGLFPDEMVREITAAVEKRTDEPPAKHPLAMSPENKERPARKQVEDVPLPEKKFEDYTREELVAMPAAEFQKLVPQATKDMSREQLEIAMQRANQAS